MKVSSVFYKRFLYCIPGILVLGLLYIFLYKIYMPRVNAFGCFDDCNNFMGGYFLLHGKKLFSEIFFNHNLGMAYLSAAIQAFTHPQNIYELVLRHRQFVLVFGLIMNLLLLVRFGFPMVAVAALFELTKFYIFGDRFLAEGIIVYPLMYMAGLGLQKMQKAKITFFDFIFAGFAAWFVVWMREPYIPLALFLLGLLLWGKDDWKRKGVSFGLFSIFSLVTLFYHNVSELYFNVYTTNALYNIPLENKSNNIFGVGLFNVFFYPLFIFFEGQKTFFRVIEVLIDILFMGAVATSLWKKQWRTLLFIFVTLGLANLRYAPPGLEYYGTFHQIVWYGLFLFFTISLTSSLTSLKLKIGGIAGLMAIILYIFISPQSFWHDKINTHEEFINNYGRYLQVGEVVDSLSKPRDTLFLDGFDDMIYWVAKRYSDYPYSWYTSLMPNFSKYTSARTHMLNTNPPDFYYGSCLKDTNPTRTLTQQQASMYVRLLEGTQPSCLWVKKTKISQITQEQWDKAKDGFYSLPTNETN